MAPTLPDWYVTFWLVVGGAVLLVVAVGVAVTWALLYKILKAVERGKRN